MKDDLIGIKEKDIQKAHKNGCDDVKKTLEDLFPTLSLEIKQESKQYPLSELTVQIRENQMGCFLNIGTSKNSELCTSQPKCKDEDGCIWIPFSKFYGIRRTPSGNFEIIPRDE